MLVSCGWVFTSKHRRSARQCATSMRLWICVHHVCVSTDLHAWARGVNNDKEFRSFHTLEISTGVSCRKRALEDLFGIFPDWCDWETLLRRFFGVAVTGSGRLCCILGWDEDFDTSGTDFVLAYGEGTSTSCGFFSRTPFVLVGVFVSSFDGSWLDRSSEFDAAAELEKSAVSTFFAWREWITSQRIREDSGTHCEGLREADEVFKWTQAPFWFDLYR